MKKLLPGIFAGLLLLIAALVFFLWGRGSEVQMRLSCELLFSRIRAYHFSQILGEDPVAEALLEALGAENSQSVSWLYNELKGAASGITWEITSVSPETASAEVQVTYTDAGECLDAYAESLAEEIVSGVEEGTLTLADDFTGLSFLTDEENLALLQSALEDIESCRSKTAAVTVSFSRKFGLWIPSGVSDEINDVVSSGLFSRMEALPDEVTALTVSGVVDYLFGLLQRFDTDALEEFTGQTMSQLIGVEETSPFYEPLLGYLQDCAALLVYTVQPYDAETRSVAVDCQYPDSQTVLQAYLQGLGIYMATHLSDPIPDDEANRQLMEDAVENTAAGEIVSATVTVTFGENDYSEYTVSDNIRDVVSANLYSEVSSLLGAITDAENQSAGLLAGLEGFFS